MDLVIVTGASKGLGLAICQRLLIEDYKVVGIARSKTDEFTKLEEENKNKLFYTKFDLIDTFQNRIHLIFIHI